MGSTETGGAADWGKAPGDVRTAWEALVARPEVARQATAIVGASLGGNLALIAGANNPEVATVIALSPGLDYQGVQPAAMLGNFGDRPVFFVASQADAPAYDGVKQMAPQTPKGETHYFVNAGHGAEMFADPALMPLLIDWLTHKLGSVEGVTTPPAPWPASTFARRSRLYTRPSFILTGRIKSSRLTYRRS